MTFTHHVLKVQLPRVISLSPSPTSPVSTQLERFEMCIISARRRVKEVSQLLIFFFEPCSRADGPGIQPVRSGHWWWVSILRGCQVELWRRGKKKKNSSSIIYNKRWDGKSLTGLSWFRFITPAFPSLKCYCCGLSDAKPNRLIMLFIICSKMFLTNVCALLLKAWSE